MNRQHQQTMSRPVNSPFPSDTTHDFAMKDGSRRLIEAIWRTYPGLTKYRERGRGA